MQKVIDAFSQLPAYVTELLSGPYLVYLVLALFLFLVVLFFNGRVAHVLRQFFILGMVGIAIIAYYKKNYPLIWLCAAALVILALYRLLVYAVVTIRQTRINHRIEKRALARAELRRGSRRRSSAPDLGEDPPQTNPQETATVAAPETKEEQGAAVTSDDAPTLPRSGAPETPEESSLSRSQVFDSMKKLEDLREAGILTEEECNEKKAKLYERLG